MATNKTLFGTTLLLIVVFIIPFLYVSNYSILYMDDFCRSFLVSENYFHNIRDWYLHHNGRFINAIFTLLPVYKITIYRLIIALQFIILSFLLFHFFRSVFKLYQLDISMSKILFISIVFYIVLLSGLPSVYEFFYWYAAVTVYLLSLYFLLFFIKYTLEFYFLEKTSFLFWGVVILLMVGNNELLIGFTNTILLLLILFYYYRHTQWSKPLLILNFLGWIGSLLVIFSPGTAFRKEQFQYSGNFIGAAKISILRVPEFFIDNLFQLPFFLFYLFLFLFVYSNINERKEVRYINPFLLIGLTLIFIALMFFTLFFATGTLDIEKGRIGSFIIATAFVILTLNIINLAAFIRGKIGFQIGSPKPVFLFSFPLVLLSLIGLFNDNYLALRKDITSGDLKEFKENYQERQGIIKSLNEKDHEIFLKPIKNTRLIRSGDTEIMNIDWVKGCYIEYLNNSNHKNIETIILK